MSAESRRQALRARVAAYRRYATLLSDQLAALDSGDIEAFQLLAAERDRLADEVDDDGVEPADAADAADPEVERLFSEAWALLRGCEETDRVVRGRLRALRDETRLAMHEIRGRGAGARRYLQGAAAPSHQLDVRL